jgi:hypothetical protein
MVDRLTGERDENPIVRWLRLTHPLPRRGGNFRGEEENFRENDREWIMSWGIFKGSI